MASPFDELDRRKLDETNKLVLVLVEQVARVQEQLTKLARSRAQRDHAWGRKYLRKMIRELRETNAQNKAYIRQLENELHLKGIE